MDNHKPPYIFRTIHDRQNTYTSVSHKLVHDKTLSFSAKGLMMYFLSHKEDTEFSLRKIAKEYRQIMGKDALKTIFDELMAKGYIHRFCIRSRGVKDYVYYIYELPKTPPTPNLESGEIRKPRLKRVLAVSGKPALTTCPENPHRSSPTFSDTLPFGLGSRCINAEGTPESSCLYAFIDFLKSIDPEYEVVDFDFWLREMKSLLSAKGVTEKRVMQILEWLPTNQFWKQLIYNPTIFKKNFFKLHHHMRVDTQKHDYEEKKAEVRKQNLARKRRLLAKKLVTEKYKERFHSIEVDVSNEESCLITLRSEKGEVRNVRANYYQENYLWTTLGLI